MMDDPLLLTVDSGNNYVKWGLHDGHSWLKQGVSAQNGNKPVTLHLPDGSSQEGVVQGVGDDGSLLLRTAAGSRGYSSGEITLCRMA
jgi:biotin-(acetyl-CoA carboxylase) ligase